MLTNPQHLNSINEIYNHNEINDNQTSISSKNLSSPNSQFHEEYNLYKNENENSNYRTNESVLTTKSSEQPNNLKHYDHVDNNLYKSPKDTLKIKNPLESVPEKSIEQSQTTNLNRSQEIESLRFRNDFETDINKYGTNQSLSSANGAYKFDKYESNFKASDKYDIDKSNVGNYISPRFQIENSEIGRSKHSNSLGKYSFNEDIDSALSISKKVNSPTGLYSVDTIDKKKQSESYNFQFKNQAIDRTLKIGSSLHLKSGNLSVDCKGNKPNFSDYDVKDKFDEKRYHSKSDVSNILKGKDFDDYGSLLQIERDKVSRLEDRLINKEKLLAQMRTYHTELWEAYEVVLKQLQKAKEEKEDKFDDMSAHIENLNNKVSALEEREFELEKENEELRNLNSERVSIVQNLERENDDMKQEIIMSVNEYQAKIEALQLRNKKLERINQESSKVDSFYYNNSSKSHDIEDKMYLKQFDDLKTIIKELSKENEELRQKIDTLLRYNREKEKSFHKFNDSSIQENRNHHNNSESFKQNAPAGHKKYLEIINRLKDENENLRIVLQSKPTLRKYKENEGKLQSLEAELEEARNLSREMKKSFSGDVGFSKKMLKSIINELQIDNVGEILPRIIELIHYERSTTKFTTCVQDLVLRCSPPGCFSLTPTLKQSWKWLKSLMEEYMNLKKVAGSENDKSILEDVMNYLVVDEKEEVTGKLKKLLVDNNLMNKIISKVKILHSIQWAHSLYEIDEKLEGELEGEIQIDSDRRKRTYKKSYN